MNDVFPGARQDKMNVISLLFVIFVNYAAASGRNEKIPDNSFIRRLSERKLSIYASLCDEVQKFGWHPTEDQLKAFHKKGLLKKHHAIVAVGLRNDDHMHALLIHKGFYRNKYLLVFKGRDGYEDAKIHCRSLFSNSWTTEAIEEKNESFLCQVRRHIVNETDPNYPVLLQCIGGNLGGAFAHSTAWSIKCQFPKQLRMHPDQLHFQVVAFEPMVYWENLEQCEKYEGILGRHNFVNIYRKGTVIEKNSPGVDLCYYGGQEGRLRLLKNGPERFALSWTKICMDYMGCIGGPMCGHFIAGNPLCVKTLKAKTSSKTKLIKG